MRYKREKKAFDKAEKAWLFIKPFLFDIKAHEHR